MSLAVLEAPSRQGEWALHQFHEAVFLAGGITGCPDWQQDAIALFEKASADLLLYNPRRENFPIHDPSAAKAQIAWEHEHLLLADAILYWFDATTVQPIVLFELGRWIGTDKPIFVGVHPNYSRRQDVLIQASLERPELEIVDDLMSLVVLVFEWSRRTGARGVRT